MQRNNNDEKHLESIRFLFSKGEDGNTITDDLSKEEPEEWKVTNEEWEYDKNGNWKKVLEETTPEKITNSQMQYERNKFFLTKEEISNIKESVQHTKLGMDPYLNSYAITWPKKDDEIRDFVGHVVGLKSQINDSDANLFDMFRESDKIQTAVKTDLDNIKKTLSLYGQKAGIEIDNFKKRHSSRKPSQPAKSSSSTILGIQQRDSNSTTHNR